MMKWIVRLLHPEAPPHEQKRHERAYYLVIIIGLTVAAAVAGVIYWIYNSGRFRR